MSSVLGDLKPQGVFKHFEKLTQIPRGSGNEKEVSDFLVNFAEDLGLEVIQEDCLNVIINKPATEGYENYKRVILQAHMDIVCTKEEGLDFDFTKDKIPLLIEGDMIRTEGTTLGADNGIALAMIMAILESRDLPHPPISALFTVEEETGMGGVLNLDSQNISGDILINLDSEEEGIVLASCAGGVKTLIKLPISWQDACEDKRAYKISIKGLLGGHSGIEIDKNRANAIKLLGRLLHFIDEDNDNSIDIAYVSGGEKMNAIAKRAEALILINESENNMKTISNSYQNIFLNEYKSADENIEINIKKVEKPNKVISCDNKRSLINILRLIPNGVQTMSPEIEGLVQSSNNIGVLVTEDEQIVFSNAVRSSVKSQKKEICNRIEIISNLNNANLEFIADYPEWEFKENSPIRKLMASVYKDIIGEQIRIEAIHAGLECGFLKQKLGDIDMVSIGPSIYDVHTPKEHLSISSTKRVYEFLCEVLKRIKTL